VLEDSVVVVVLLLDIVDELVSLLVAGALVLGFWLLASVLVPDVWAMDTPPAMAAATASVVNAFRVAFIVFTPWDRAAGGTWQLEEKRRRVPAGFQIRTALLRGKWGYGGRACRTCAVTICVEPCVEQYASGTVRHEWQGFLTPAFYLQGRIGAFATQGDVFIHGKPQGGRADQSGRRWIAVELMWQWGLVGHGTLPVRLGMSHS
jgi:hypothetical protein